MKIAFVVHDYNRSGGHSRYVAELAERYAHEHEVHVFANRIDRNGESGIHFHHVRALRLSALTCILTFPVFARSLPLDTFDVVHAQGWCGTRQNVLTAHICNEAWFDARKTFADRVTPKERLFAALVNPLERKLYRGSKDAWVIAISDRVRDDLATYYDRSEKVAVIYHGVDVERFNPRTREGRAGVRREVGLAETDLVALFVGDLRKGVDTAARALEAAEGWKLLVVSWTPPEPYRAAVERAGLGDRVVFAPPSREIERFYGAADAFVFPTPYDAFGMVITEAMASGLPVITSRQAGASELVDHERTGLLLDDPSNREEIAGWLRRLRDDAEYRERLGRAARERVETLTWDAIAAETMVVYERVVEERGS